MFFVRKLCWPIPFSGVHSSQFWKADRNFEKSLPTYAPSPSPHESDFVNMVNTPGLYTLHMYDILIETFQATLLLIMKIECEIKGLP